MCFFKPLLGNKIDLVQLNENFRRISLERAGEFAKKFEIKHYDECSAKDNYNIENIFSKLYKGNNNAWLCPKKDIYTVQKDKLEEKTNDYQKVIDSKKQDPKTQCC